MRISYPINSTPRKREMPTGSLMLLVGLNIKFGKGYTKTKPVYYEAEPVVVEQPKPAPVVEQPKPKQEVGSGTANETGYLLCFELSEDTRRSKSQK